MKDENVPLFILLVEINCCGSSYRLVAFECHVKEVEMLGSRSDSH